MSKGKTILAAVTVIFGCLATLAPPLAGWYTNKKLKEIDEKERKDKDGGKT